MGKDGRTCRGKEEPRELQEKMCGGGEWGCKEKGVDSAMRGAANCNLKFPSKNRFEFWQLLLENVKVYRKAYVI